MGKGRWAGFGVAMLVAMAGMMAAVAHPGHPHPALEVDEFEEEAEGVVSFAAHPRTGGEDSVLVLTVALVMAGLWMAREREDRTLLARS